jgi:ABC-type Fe3+/spermidine/putrescine transport system ATPase subunit
MTSAANQFNGRVVNIIYIGTDTYYEVRLASEQLLRVREQNHTPGSRPLASEGDEVTVAFSVQAARVLTG